MSTQYYRVALPGPDRNVFWNEKPFRDLREDEVKESSVAYCQRVTCIRIVTKALVAVNTPFIGLGNSKVAGTNGLSMY